VYKGGGLRVAGALERHDGSTAKEGRNMAGAATTNPQPPGNFGYAQMLPMLIFDVALPIVLFNVLTRYGVPTLWALVAGGLSPAVNNLRLWVKSRRIEPLGIIVIAFLAVGTAVSLISGSVFFALIKDSFLTATFGFICLGSLFARRPLLFYINRQFVAGDDPARLEWWNGLWELSDFRAAMRLVTAVWGITYLLEALLRVALALVLSPAQVVMISPIMAFGVLIVLIAWTRRHLLAVRERRLRAQQESVPS
jgi:intracellular septation protein A